MGSLFALQSRVGISSWIGLGRAAATAGQFQPPQLADRSELNGRVNRASPIAPPGLTLHIFPGEGTSDLVGVSWYSFHGSLLICLKRSLEKYFFGSATGPG